MEYEREQERESERTRTREREREREGERERKCVRSRRVIVNVMNFSTGNDLRINEKRNFRRIYLDRN